MDAWIPMASVGFAGLLVGLLAGFRLGFDIGQRAMHARLRGVVLEQTRALAELLDDLRPWLPPNFVELVDETRRTLRQQIENLQEGR